VIRNLALLAGVCLAFWGIVAFPAQWLWGNESLIFSSVACAICLIPAVLTLAWGQWALIGSPERQLAAVLGGTGVRLLFAAGVGMVLFQMVPFFGHAQFMIWIIVFYLVTLLIEMGLLLSWQAAVNGPRNQ
jgi:hypothetical protein